MNKSAKKHKHALKRREKNLVAKKIKLANKLRRAKEEVQKSATKELKRGIAHTPKAVKFTKPANVGLDREAWGLKDENG